MWPYATSQRLTAHEFLIVWRTTMRGVNQGEVWMIDFGMAAKVRPALLLTGEPGADELDLVTVLLHTTALRRNRWELAIDKSFLKAGAFHLQQVQSISTVKLERRLGVLNGEEMSCVRAALKYRLSL
jgi:mRNA interferase MazF